MFFPYFPIDFGDFMGFPVDCPPFWADGRNGFWHRLGVVRDPNGIDLHPKEDRGANEFVGQEGTRRKTVAVVIGRLSRVAGKTKGEVFPKVNLTWES